MGDKIYRVHPDYFRSQLDVTIYGYEVKAVGKKSYITTKNRQNDRERIEMKKYCRFDRQHTLHKETR